MKFASALLITALLGTSTSFAATSIKVDCKSPEGLMGNSATITGSLIKSEAQGEEYDVVEGTLRVMIGGSTLKPVMDAKVKVSGVVLDDGSISLAATETDSIQMIYLNSKRADVSYVEKDGSQYLSNCKAN